MLNRRILRIKAFKALYAAAEVPGMSQKEALSLLEESCEATRDLYLYMLSVVTPLTQEARKRIEAAKGKFNPTEEELHPNMKFAENAVSAILEEDPDFQKLLAKKKLSWDNNDVLVRSVFDSICSKPWFADYMADPGRSLAADAKLFKKIFEEEFEDNDALSRILEDMNIHWTDDLGYVLRLDMKAMDALARTGRWTYPELYADPSDHVFVTRLVKNTQARYAEVTGMVAANVREWERDRLFTTDLVLIAMGLVEAESFPEIPVRVTLNEYVEICKFFSTPKSRPFVNGLLDRLIRESVESGRIVKDVLDRG